MSNINTFEINSDLTEVKVMAAHFQNFCSIKKINTADSSLLELVFVEALNNIIIHAYDNVAGFKINANYELSKAQVIITVSDSGKAFHIKNDEPDSPTKDETPNKDNVELEELAEGNWGLDLMNSIADDIIRYRENNINILKIKKNIDT